MTSHQGILRPCALSKGGKGSAGLRMSPTDCSERSPPFHFRPSLVPVVSLGHAGIPELDGKAHRIRLHTSLGILSSEKGTFRGCAELPSPRACIHWRRFSLLDIYPTKNSPDWGRCRESDPYHFFKACVSIIFDLISIYNNAVGPQVVRV